MKMFYKIKHCALAILATSLMVLSFSTFSAVITYKVKKNDTLSTILYDHDLGPLYGKNGILKKMALMQKMKHGVDYIRVGEIIELPSSEESEKIVGNIKPMEELTKKSRTPSSDSGEFPYSHFVYSPHLAFLKIDSTNDTAFGGSNIMALSKSGFGFDLAWHLFYDDQISFFGFGAIDYFSFYNDPNYSFNRLNMTRLHFGVGENFDYSEGLRFTSKLSLREVSFLDIATPTSVRLESFSVPEIEAGFDKRLFAKKQFIGKWGVHILGLIPGSRGSYKSKLGYGAGAHFLVGHKDKELFLIYDLRSIQINEIKNTESSVHLGINFTGVNVL